MDNTPCQKINDAADKNCSPEELYSAFLAELSEIEKQGKDELEGLQKKHTEAEIEETRKKIAES